MATTHHPEVGLTGAWPYDGFPPRVTINGRDFELARFRWYRFGVQAQYRERVPGASIHLLVLDDGTWLFHHIDEWNPDQGHPLLHLVADFVPSRAGAFLGLALVGGVLGAAFITRKTK